MNQNTPSPLAESSFRQLALRWLIAPSLLVMAGCWPLDTLMDAGSTTVGPAVDASAPPPPAPAPMPVFLPTSAPSLADAGALPDLGSPAATSPDLGSPALQGASAHHRCGWIFTSDPVAAQTFLDHASWYDALHPDWYALESDGVTVRPLYDVDNAAILAAAAANHVAIIPLITSVEDTAWTRTMLYDPAKRAAHIRNLVAIAVTHNYAGVDIDYEHLWDLADKAPLAAFIAELGAAMHAAKKQVSMAVPALSNPSTVWSYADLAASLDAVHLMGYDYHTVGGDHAGPTAPLGWIEAVAQQVAATGHAEKFLLGLPNYGVTTSAACPLGTCASWCTTAVQTTSTHMANCPNGAWPTADRILSCETANGTLFFDDVSSLESKVQTAAAHGLGGVGYWNLGGEPTGFFDMIRRYY